MAIIIILAFIQIFPAGTLQTVNWKWKDRQRPI